MGKAKPLTIARLRGLLTAIELRDIADGQPSRHNKDIFFIKLNGHDKELSCNIEACLNKIVLRVLE